MVALLVALEGLLATGCTRSRAPAAAFDGPVVRSETVDSRGLVVEVMREAPGDDAKNQPAVRPGDWVRVHYTTRVDTPSGAAQIVDSSREPLGFTVGRSTGLIEGLHLGVVGMRVGELRRLSISPQLGYRGRSLGSIPGDAQLRMDLELTTLTPHTNP